MSLWLPQAEAALAQVWQGKNMNAK
jgi:hypothetical protein